MIIIGVHDCLTEEFKPSQSSIKLILLSLFFQEISCQLGAY